MMATFPVRYLITNARQLASVFQIEHAAERLVNPDNMVLDLGTLPITLPCGLFVLRVR
jgi:hypothetical protein